VSQAKDIENGQFYQAPCRTIDLNQAEGVQRQGQIISKHSHRGKKEPGFQQATVCGKNVATFVVEKFMGFRHPCHCTANGK